MTALDSDDWLNDDQRQTLCAFWNEAAEIHRRTLELMQRSALSPALMEIYHDMLEDCRVTMAEIAQVLGSDLNQRRAALH